MRESAVNSLRALASLKLTLAGIAVLLVAVLLAYFNQPQTAAYIVPAVILLAVNLLAAIIFNARIRQNTGLLMFHICLLLIALLTLLSQLTSMKGRVEVTQGAAFDPGSVTVTEQGAWHPIAKLQQVAFVQDALQVEYAAGLRRGTTRSQLLLDNGDSLLVGDNLAYTSEGYRFYTTSNKGFAAVVKWHAKDGSVAEGAIHFPSYPLYDWKQHNRWQAPSGEQLAFRLMIDTPLDRDRDWVLQNVQYGQLEITRAEGGKHVLIPGDYIELDGGVLEFAAIRMWMGYKIFYDPLLAWFLAVALVGVAGLAWHYYLRLSSSAKQSAFAGREAGRGRAVSTIRS